MKIETKLNNQDKDKIYKKYKYFPMDLLWNDEHWYHNVIGVKGDGKTYGKLLKMIDIFESGKHSVEIVQTKEKIKELMRFKDYFDRLLVVGNDEIQEDERILNFIDGLEYRDMSIWKDDSLVVKFIPLLGMDKNKDLVGANTAWVVEDETHKDRYEKGTAYATQLILDTIFRKRSDIKFTQLGNAITLNHPMFLVMDLYTLSDDIITVHKDDNDNVLCKVWNWKRPYEDIEESYKDSPLFTLMKKTGYVDFAFKNEFKNDNLDNLITDPNEDMLKVMKYIHTFKVQDIFVDVFYIEAKDNSLEQDIYYYKVNKDKDVIKKVKYALTQEDANDNIIYAPDIGVEIARRLQHNTMYYDSIASKSALWNTIKKWF